MFELIVFEDKIRVPAANLGLDIKEAISKSLAEKYENRIIKDTGVMLAITDIKDISGGNIIPEDAGVYYHTKFEMLVYQPKMYEVIEGVVVDITDFGVFIRFGPLDGLCHTSQIINDYVTYDKKSAVLSARDSKKTLKIGDLVKARVIAISLEKKEINKINLTMRQPHLGALHWIEEDQKKAEKVKAKK